MTIGTLAVAFDTVKTTPPSVPHHCTKRNSPSSTLIVMPYRPGFSLQIGH